MYSAKNYINRGSTFLNNKIFPSRKRLSTLMFYGTDLCDSACQHCLIWTKRPVKFLPLEKIIEVMQSRCVTRHTMVGLEGGEFLLHPNAMDILSWFSKHHPNYDLLTNGLKPENVSEALAKFTPQRLFISLDGPKETYQSMRGKDGYDGIIRIIEKHHKQVPISAMFTLSPYNDFNDLEHVAQVCKKYQVDLRIGVYNNISFFDTLANARASEIGSLKNSESLTYKTAKHLTESRQQPEHAEHQLISIKDHLPPTIREFAENYDFLLLFDEWRRGNLRLNCHSILDSLVVLPNGDVPICQHLDVMLGNVFADSLDTIFNAPASVEKQAHYEKNCNACWINFHRKYDVILYRNFEKYFGRFVTTKLLGYYWWEAEKKKTYRQLINA
ncbi:radical SAM protein [Flavisolibacter nicotianae]|uniref:radical SAM protein n=1 Tax=Flavisolibacter nicotianae TaxID=2364882 RepID=UPI000EB30EE7